jgi:dihydroorotase-like cyclic amidohydrolase
MKRKAFHLPTCILNVHVHARDLKQSHKTTILETLKQATEAGIKMIGVMPNTDPPIISLAVLKKYYKVIDAAIEELDSPVAVGVWFGVTDNNLVECKKALHKTIGLKIYPLSSSGKAVTTGKIGVAKFETIVKAMSLAKKMGKLVAVHCDHPDIIEAEGYTIRAEVEYVKLVIEAMRQVPGVKVLICHVSCKKSAKIILAAQKEGLKIAIELCPQYLWFDKTGTNWRSNLHPNFYKCFNNLRGSADRKFLVSLLKLKNELIIVSSDHAPHTGEEKIAGAGGIPCLCETIPVILTLAIENNISAKQVANLLSFNAAKFLGARLSGGRLMKPVKIIYRQDSICYNQGRVINPWLGSKMYFLDE